MYLLPAIKRLIERNVWIPIGLLSSGILLLKLSDASALISFIRWFLPNLSYDFVENLFVISGLLSLVASFYTFYVWIIAYDKKRKNKRKLAMQQAAQSMGWSYSENPSLPLRSRIDSLMECRLLGVPSHINRKSHSTSNVMSAEIDGDLLIIFDCVVSGINDTNESFTEFETAYLVVSDKLNLPYFQTQPESWIGDNAVGSYLKKKAGVNDIDFPTRPDFSKKYVVDGNRETVERVFTSAVFDFYEQNRLYRTIGDGKMLCLLQWQAEPFDQVQINTQLQTLRYLYQLLKSK